MPRYWNLSIRFRLQHPDEQEAAEYLQQLELREGRPAKETIIAAVLEYKARQSGEDDLTNAIRRLESAIQRLGSMKVVAGAESTAPASDVDEGTKSAVRNLFKGIG